MTRVCAATGCDRPLLSGVRRDAIYCSAACRREQSRARRSTSPAKVLAFPWVELSRRSVRSRARALSRYASRHVLTNKNAPAAVSSGPGAMTHRGEVDEHHAS